MIQIAFANKGELTNVILYVLFAEVFLCVQYALKIITTMSWKVVYLSNAKVFSKNVPITCVCTAKKCFQHLPQFRIMARQTASV